MDPKPVLHLLNKILQSWQSITLNRQLSPFLAKISLSLAEIHLPNPGLSRWFVWYSMKTWYIPNIHPYPPHQDHHQLQHRCSWGIPTAPQTRCGRRNLGKVSALARCEDFVHFANTCQRGMFSCWTMFLEVFFLMLEAKEPLYENVSRRFFFNRLWDIKVLWLKRFIFELLVSINEIGRFHGVSGVV